MHIQESIRHYIDLVEGFVQPKHNAIPFGRRNASELDDARKYSSAEEYAHAHNPHGQTNIDPPHIRHLYQREQERLMAKWNHWKAMGLVGMTDASA